MAHISPKIIQEVKSRNRLEDVLRIYGVELDSRNKALCPFHKEKTPSFSVKPEEQIFTCFGKCNFTGDVFTFVEKKEGVSRLEAIKILADRVGIKLDNTEVKKINTKFQTYYEINDTVNKYFKNTLLSKEGSEALKYLTERNMSKELINEFNIGLASSNKLYNILSKKYKTEDLYDLGLIIFSLIINIWATMFLKNWKNIENMYRYYWGMEKYSVTQGQSEFYIPDQVTPFILGEVVNNSSTFKTIIKNITSFCVCSLLIIFRGLIVFLICSIACAAVKLV